MSESRYAFQRIAAVVFIAEIAYMALELLAARMMSPFFGNTNAVWTAVIGIILASSALGNWLGGKLADRRNPAIVMMSILIAAGLTTAIIPYLAPVSLQALSEITPDARIGALLATTVLFFIPSLALGTVIPIAVALVVEDVETVGRKSGSIYAISTVGAIAGTFLTGFFLIPAFDAYIIVWGCAAVLCVVTFLIPFEEASRQSKHVKMKMRIGWAVAAAVLVFSAFGIFSGGSEDGEVLLYEGDSEYNRIQVLSGYENGTSKPLRLMKVGIHGYQSLTYCDDDKYKLPLAGEYYPEYYDKSLDPEYVEGGDSPKKILMIGGGGYSYPKHCIADSKNSIDVVEIDPKVTELAKEYFFLDDLIGDYKLDPSSDDSRLRIHTEDGRVFLNNAAKSDGKYDRIFNDAFSGTTPPPTLASKEAVQAIKDSLTEDGIYATNIIGAAKGQDSRFLTAELKTIASVFKHVYVFPSSRQYSEDKAEEKHNWMVMATDSDTKLSALDVGLDYSDGMLLTDSHCPVEELSGEYS